MLKDIITKQALLDRATILRKKRFRPGFDGMSMDGAKSWIHINGERLCKDIIAGDYSPMPAIGFRTAKHHGGFRNLNRISAIDTVIQHTIYNHILPKAEAVFSDNSFAYRPGRGVNSALERYVGLANHYRFVIKCDFGACFDSIDHDILSNTLLDFSGDEAFKNLCMTFVKMPVAIDGEIVETEKGLLQGMPLAPFFCNMYLHSADEHLSALKLPFIRYADDLVVFANSEGDAQTALEDITSFFETELKLKLNKKKTKIDSPTRITFLGHRFSADKKGAVALSSDDGSKIFNQLWENRKAYNNRRRVDFISDGILRQKHLSLLWDTETVDSVIPVVSTDVINVYSDVVFDSGVLNLALKNGITINIFDKYGECTGSFTPSSSLKAPRTTFEQLSAYYDADKRAELAREILLASIHNTNLIIRYYNKQTPNALYKKVLNRLQYLKTTIKAEHSSANLLMLEAHVRNAYYSCFDSFIKRDGFVFEKRTRKPPENEVNALLSFGNTALYNFIATEIQKTSLDVRVAFLHSTCNRAKSLNLDIAEIFKPLIVDRVVFSLINRGEILPEHFCKSEKGTHYLSPEGKRIFLRAFYNKLDSELTIGGKASSYRELIIEELRKLVRNFRGAEKYKAYRQVR